MAIAKKPILTQNNNFLIDSIINKGGSSPKVKSNDENVSLKVTVRISTKMLDLIDNHLKGILHKKTRNSWLLEAIEEKINRDIGHN